VAWPGRRLRVSMTSTLIPGGSSLLERTDERQAGDIETAAASGSNERTSRMPVQSTLCRLRHTLVVGAVVTASAIRRGATITTPGHLHGGRPRYVDESSVAVERKTV
jgi:hypothetical protein